jgi:hypothetical protein
MELCLEQGDLAIRDFLEKKQGENEKQAIVKRLQAVSDRLSNH